MASARIRAASLIGVRGRVISTGNQAVGSPIRLMLGLRGGSIALGVQAATFCEGADGGFSRFRHAGFELVADDQHIATMDADGVARAAIQGLNQKVLEQRAELKHKQTEITEMKQAVHELKELVQALNHKLNGGAK